MKLFHRHTWEKTEYKRKPELAMRVCVECGEKQVFMPFFDRWWPKRCVDARLQRIEDNRNYLKKLIREVLKEEGRH